MATTTPQRLPQAAAFHNRPFDGATLAACTASIAREARQRSIDLGNPLGWEPLALDHRDYRPATALLPQSARGYGLGEFTYGLLIELQAWGPQDDIAAVLTTAALQGLAPGANCEHLVNQLVRHFIGSPLLFHLDQLSTPLRAPLQRMMADNVLAAGRVLSVEEMAYYGSACTAHPVPGVLPYGTRADHTHALAALLLRLAGQRLGLGRNGWPQASLEDASLLVYHFMQAQTPSARPAGRSSLSTYVRTALESLPLATRRSPEEVQALCRNWEQDACWDLEETEDYEAHYAELLAFSEDRNQEWTMSYQAREDERWATQAQVAAHLGCTPALLAHIEGLEARIAELEAERQPA